MRSFSARFILFVVPLLLLVVSACTASATPTSERNGAIETAPTISAPTMIPTATPTPNWAKADLTLRLEALAEGFREPVGVVPSVDGTRRLFVLQRKGLVRVVQDGKVLDAPYLDLRGKVASKVEQALQAITFAPDFDQSGLVYVTYNRTTDGALVLERYRVSTDPNRLDAGSVEEILVIPHPELAHHGGQVAFGADGYLYVSVGDGSAEGEGYGKNGQALDTLLGKILRIDVSGPLPYRVPSTNPFVIDSAARPEIWAYGLRNPWRMTFDSATGDLYIADVGEKTFEEVNVQPSSSEGGENYGWSLMEGAQCFKPAKNCESASLTLPVFAYPHAYGCAIIGGTVYRGEKIPSLRGKYLFGDFCLGRVWALGRDGANAWRAEELGVLNRRIGGMTAGEDGNIYLVDYQKGILFRLVVE